MNVPMQNTVADYYQAHYTGPRQHRPVVESLSALDFTAPGLAAYKLAKMRQNALGAEPETPLPGGEPAPPEWLKGPTGWAIIAGVVVIAGALNYQMGKAMAPNQSKAKSWGWMGVPLGFVPLGLPIMAIVSNSTKGW